MRRRNHSHCRYLFEFGGETKSTMPRSLMCVASHAMVLPAEAIASHKNLLKKDHTPFASRQIHQGRLSQTILRVYIQLAFVGTLSLFDLIVYLLFNL